jgi:type IV pilus assembly protein PilW
VLAGGADSGFLGDGNVGLRGHSGTGSGFSPALPAALAGVSPAPLNSSDIVTVRVPADAATLGVVAAMASGTAAPQLQASAPENTIRTGDVVLIANCKAAAIFQVTSADPLGTGSLAHAVGAASAPGNASTDLLHAFRSDAAVVRLQTRHYYVAPSTLRPGTNSLWRFTVPASDPGDNPVEVASGVDRLSISYGVDTAVGSLPDQNINRYLDAASVTDWERVLAARVQMLVATAQDNMATGHQSVQFAGATVTGADRRVRTALTEVVTLRNAAP